MLHVTDRCNQHCRTCFIKTNATPPFEELSLNDIRTISRYLPDLIFVDIGGGEPFLRKDLADICAVLNTRYLAIPTNGFNPEYIADTTHTILKAIKAPLTLSVSLDGFENTNDYIRGTGSYKNALRTFTLLKAIPMLYLTINTVLSNANYREIIPFMKYVRKLKPDFHSISFLRGIPRSPEMACPPVQALKEIQKDVLTIWRTYSYGLSGLGKYVLRNYHKQIYRSSLRVMVTGRQHPRCRAFRDHLVIYPNGDVAFCEMLAPFGNILKQPLDRLVRGKKAVRQIKLIKHGDCFCYHNCNLMDNYFLNFFQYPRLLLGI